MKIKVLFFGATADITGKRQFTFEASERSTAQDLSNSLLSKYPKLGSQRLLFSINQQYATGNERLHDGDEFAIFTAVSGG